MWSWKDVFASKCNVRVVAFFLRSWQRRRRSEIRLLLSSKRSSLSLYHLRDVWALTEKQPVSTSMGVFRHEVAQTDLTRKNLNEKASAYMIVRPLGKRGSSSEGSPVLACAIFFWIFCQNSFERDVGHFAATWLAFLAMVPASMQPVRLEAGRALSISVLIILLLDHWAGWQNGWRRFVRKPFGQLLI